MYFISFIVGKPAKNVKESMLVFGAVVVYIALELGLVVPESPTLFGSKRRNPN